MKCAAADLKSKGLNVSLQLAMCITEHCCQLMGATGPTGWVLVQGVQRGNCTLAGPYLLHRFCSILHSQCQSVGNTVHLKMETPAHFPIITQALSPERSHGTTPHPSRRAPLPICWICTVRSQSDHHNFPTNVFQLSILLMYIIGFLSMVIFSVSSINPMKSLPFIFSFCGFIRTFSSAFPTSSTES